MRTIVAIFLSLVININLFIQIGALSWYEINKSVIIKELCIQKDAQKNTCNGNCELSKRLKITNSTSDSNDQNNPILELKLLTFLFEIPETSFNTLTQDLKHLDKLANSNLLSSHLSKPIKPPINC